MEHSDQVFVKHSNALGSVPVTRYKPKVQLPSFETSIDLVSQTC